MVNITLYKVSINSIFINGNISNVVPTKIIFNKYIPTSYIRVTPAVISKIVILLSFEKFCSKYPAINTTQASIIAEVPIFFPIKKSKNIPITNMIGIPRLLPKNSPKNNAIITNKFGDIPAIVNQFDCKKYIIKNVINIDITITVFFN